MTHNVECLEKLINSFSKLSGVGYKTAEKYAYNIINLNEEDVKLFAENLINTKKLVKFCSICGNFTQDDICNICKTRKSNTICVVKEPKDVIAIEKSKTYKGLYHILHGTINPLAGVGPNDIRIKELLSRVSSGETS